MNEIISIKLDDNVHLNIVNIKSIHSDGKYEDFRITIEAKFFNIKEFIKIDLTTGDVVTSKEVETILSRNIANTRARDFYDIHILTYLNKGKIDRGKLIIALKEKCIERNTIVYLTFYKKYIDLISDSSELKETWKNYQNKNKYATDINWIEVIKSLEYLLN